MGLGSGSEADGAPGPRAVRARRVILEAAVRVLVVDRGASMREISDAAGVGRATLHRYFPGRGDLIRAIAMDVLGECEAAIGSARIEEGTVVEALARLVEALVPIGERFHFLLYEAQLQDDPEFAAADDRILRTVEGLIERGKRVGTFRPEVPAAWIGDALEALIYAAWESVRDGKIARRDAPGLVITTFLSGLGGGREQS
ncbi:MAG: TetR/AcrR family transcriptional regulator [Rubrobacter sp.]